MPNITFTKFNQKVKLFNGKIVVRRESMLTGRIIELSVYFSNSSDQCMFLLACNTLDMYFEDIDLRIIGNIPTVLM